MKPSKKFTVEPNNFVASLREAAAANSLTPEKLSVPLPVMEGSEDPEILDRHDVFLTDGEKAGVWRVSSLRELFRGQELPPANINKYPEDYVPLFWQVEKQVIMGAQLLGDPTDGQLEEWYSNLRRRPDGRSLGLFHDYLWQVAALMLGTHPLSQAQFEGVIGTLALSASRWRQGGSSRNYMFFLRQHRKV
jgi:hypothetical protein